MQEFLVAACLALIVAAATVGCGGGPHPTYPVEGTVKFSDGTPLKGGWIEVRLKAGSDRVLARGAIDVDGTFLLSTFQAGDGAVLGKHQVIVSPALPAGEQGDRPIPTTVIHVKHTRFDTSAFEFDVTQEASPNRWDIVVERAPRTIR